MVQHAGANDEIKTLVQVAGVLDDYNNRLLTPACEETR